MKMGFLDNSTADDERRHGGLVHEPRQCYTVSQEYKSLERDSDVIIAASQRL